MRIVYFALVILSHLITAAHFYRWRSYIFLVICLCSVILPFIRKKFSLYIMQSVLFFETATWAITTYKLIQMRLHYNLPYQRMFFILLGVILFIAFLFVVSFNKNIKTYFSNSSDNVNKKES